MQPNYFAFSRVALKEFEDNLLTKIPWAASTVMIRFLILASHTPGMYQGVAMNRGDVMIGRDELSAKTGLSVKTIRNILSFLVTQKFIEKRGHQRGQRKKRVFRGCI